MAKPFKEGKGWAVRIRVKGQDIYLSGFTSETAARNAAEQERVAIKNAGKPQGAGARKTSLAQALQKSALERLPSLKGARHDVGRINRYLRLAGLKNITLAPIKGSVSCYWKVSLDSVNFERTIPNSLQEHRGALLEKSQKSDALRKRLGAMMMADITPYHIQQLLDAMVEEGYEPATIAHERSELRRLFNHAQKCWLWTFTGCNPASAVKVPKICNARDRVISNDEWQRLTIALSAYGNPYVLPALALLLETTMRSSEPLLHANWVDVDWERRVINLQDAKAGPRAVPLSPNAIQILQNLKMLAGEVSENTKILPITYEVIKKAWRTTCEQADVKCANIHDLRHTGTTRYAIELNGNLPILKLITGHKTDSQLMRYINLKVDDVVSLMHNTPMNEGTSPAGLKLSNVLVARTIPPEPAIETSPQNLPENVVLFTKRRVA